MIYFDIESDNLLRDATVIWCIVAYDNASNQYYIYHKAPCDLPSGAIGYTDVNLFLKEVLQDKELCTFNGVKFDLPLLTKLYGFSYSLHKQTDCYLLSTLQYPDRPGHSLRYFGDLLGFPKGEHTDWTQFSQEMLDYCIQDVKVLIKTHQYLIEEAGTWDWAESVKLEYAIADIQMRQELTGVLFDVDKAVALSKHLAQELQYIEGVILKGIPAKAYKVGETVNKPFKKNGELTKQCQEWGGGLIGGQFSKVEWRYLNLNSHEQIKDYLLTQGWRPTEYTIKGSPKLTEDSFGSASGEVPSLVAKRSILIHRKRMLDSVKKSGEEGGLLSFLRDDGRVEARAITNGTPTARMRHSQVVNVPSVDTLYGAEIRELFRVPTGYVLAGIDAQALEARCMSHYLLSYPGGVEIADILLNGDVHQVNADLWGCGRKEAKAPFYALNFGAQPKKLAETMGVPLKEAKVVYKQFWEFYKPLDLFKKDLIKAWEARGGAGKGFLRGLDGRKLYARSAHSLVNLMVQSTGSIIVKTSLCFIDKYTKMNSLDAKQVIVMHDEGQFEVLAAHVDAFKQGAERAFLKSGNYWKMKVPMPGKLKVGMNWKETH